MEKSTEQQTSQTAAYAFLRALKSNGISTILANSGTDFPSLIEAIAAAPGLGLDLPQALVIHHESVAMGMAHGHYLVSGKPLAVMVHVNVGLANAAMGALNAKASQIPILMCSGRTPITEQGRFGSRSVPIHWGQEMFDQASLVREAVKWEYELRYPEQAGPLVGRALAIATEEPAGPVFLSLPREPLAEAIEGEVEFIIAPKPSISIPDTGEIKKAAVALAQADCPVIIVQRSAPSGALEGLEELVEKNAIPVVEFWGSANCLATTHPMHAGFDPSFVLKEADVVLAIGAMVPWIATQTNSKEITLIQLGNDPLAADRPINGFQADIILKGNANRGILMLTDELSALGNGDLILARARKQKNRKSKQLDNTQALIKAGERSPMNHAYVSSVLAKLAGPQALIFSELGAVGQAMELTGSGQLFGTPLAGGLGWGVPAALGAKLAQPEKTVIATVGDGSYIFANPAACHQVAALHELPILTLVFNNGIWNAVKRATTAMYGDGDAVRSNDMPLTSLGQSPDYCAMARAHGAYGELVENPDDLAPAIERALHQTQVEKRQALLEVKVA